MLCMQAVAWRNISERKQNFMNCQQYVGELIPKFPVEFDKDWLVAVEERPELGVVLPEWNDKRTKLREAMQNDYTRVKVVDWASQIHADRHFSSTHVLFDNYVSSVRVPNVTPEEHFTPKFRGPNLSLGNITLQIVKASQCQVNVEIEGGDNSEAFTCLHFYSHLVYSFVAPLGFQTGIDGSVGDVSVRVFDIEIEGATGDVSVGVFDIEIEGAAGDVTVGVFEVQIESAAEDVAVRVFDIEIEGAAGDVSIGVFVIKIESTAEDVAVGVFEVEIEGAVGDVSVGVFDIEIEGAAGDVTIRVFVIKVESTAEDVAVGVFEVEIEGMSAMAPSGCLTLKLKT
ncbi:uncharacterized protein LACBIDRAFT_333283 [Laccaria bicolor S238N-H82]|uniref:Predicted protein n=2 Tax=Laccaria bicolor (strain S238N-H82 / ATCC MYA-4686) TaxID=486041 RepID=B0DVG6_LACBS|nr:uncharacterized protein LACBIDRAFT_333283 [Laccaria bicolor S238N-H82]EDR01379.1 predicted protein [Laccaria bicolor S238N-H82]|eukprot:XP_001887924.1 predicted protein [Laccaria bicolor S238N-H82]